MYSSKIESLMTGDNISSITGTITSILEKAGNPNTGNIIYVLDRIDSLSSSESPREVIKCFSKLHELSEQFNIFTFVFVVRRSDFLDLSTLSIPTIKFENYGLDAFKDIINMHYYDTFWNLMETAESKNVDSDTEMSEVDHEEHTLKLDEQEKRVFFRQFLNLITETYSSYIGLSIDVLIPILRRIWPIFIKPLIRHKRIIKGKNDVFTTFMKNKKLLSKEFSVVTKLENSDMNLVDYQQSDIDNQKITEESKKGHYDLSIKTKYLVIAAFLASYNEPKYDSQYFSKGDNYNTIMKHKTKRTKVVESGAGRLRRAMSAAIPFKLERLLAILNSIWTENVGIELLDDVELMTEIATLTSLKTLVKLKIGDTIGGQTKWKCNVHWNVVKKFADDVGFDILNHLQD
ncbi:hypothetical protein CANINC_003392 [Pichia inconspicua]|uniref:Orc1-like AAA ATPase domain-containing protein n=1 Tax=Pichia inconspicua TaxID=52247 RepID=A0A4T0WYU6_9ASCO|nr:hypothetical protein CANINC_003392 [[Candida] inconspicua]